MLAGSADYVRNVDLLLTIPLVMEPDKNGLVMLFRMVAQVYLVANVHLSQFGAVKPTPSGARVESILC